MSLFFIPVVHYKFTYDLYSLANAWEEEDEVVLITCRLENPALEIGSGAVNQKLENFTNEL